MVPQFLLILSVCPRSVLSSCSGRSGLVSLHVHDGSSRAGWQRAGIDRRLIRPLRRPTGRRHPTPTTEGERTYARRRERRQIVQAHIGCVCLADVLLDRPCASPQSDAFIHGRTWTAPGVSLSIDPVGSTHPHTPHIALRRTLFSSPSLARRVRDVFAVRSRRRWRP